MKKQIIAIADDHVLMSNALASMINSFENYTIMFQATNGKDLIDKLKSTSQHPDIILMDINMPVMDGIEATAWINTNLPNIKVLALSVDNQDETIIKMLKAGACGYVLKNVHPNTFSDALREITEKGFYHSEMVSKAMYKMLQVKTEEEKKISLTDRHVQFIKLACSEKTYKEIADEMCVSPKTVDGYRVTLFEKFGVKSRTGLVLYAIKNGLFSYEDEE